MPGFVYLVGAGPGDPDLITVKGLNLIKKADVIVYDRLVNPVLLTYARKDAELIYAGKAPERHEYLQEEINKLLVEKALAGKTVVRLKGGDPFVFGRGGEEALELTRHGIPFEVVPGITSAIAVPAYAGIPVTHREVAASFCVITGNEDPTKKESQINWEKVALAADTLVFLMGRKNLPQIVANLLKYGRPPQTPVAVIRLGTRAEQRTVTGCLQDIEEKVRKADLKHPVIIVVGETVKLREQLNWFETKRLMGKRILVTQSSNSGKLLACRLKELGAEVWHLPQVEYLKPESYREVDRELQRLNEYKYILFTSPNGVEFFLNRLKCLELSIDALPEIIAIGEKTKKALENSGINVAHKTDRFLPREVVKFIAGRLQDGEKILFPKSEKATILELKLREERLPVKYLPVYKAVRAKVEADHLFELIDGRKIDFITFVSPAAVNNFFESLTDEKRERLAEIKMVSMGLSTTAEIKRYGNFEILEAKRPGVDGILEKILEAAI
ncbi:uroporphyrinogen-III C-methyltransferase [Carboxydothermus ferrireducens]|uniref:uroporphyrinogen-III C-methyltransferase n=1 Tax=Carboxydothermus ferrireducens DSM 11255 TaxID=1119529 RepID=A0ABX2R9K8_9THEO|nr:uroporphyrinogen-III C-methyltransferase [Carboxydothermus ferrireducens]NYE57859.1 uroporphyrinogen III methyltransferase/synthase [Carboxydothermus ferrireducens DSM 11255]